MLGQWFSEMNGMVLEPRKPGNCTQGKASRAADLGGWRSGWLGRPRGQGMGVMDRVGVE